MAHAPFTPVLSFESHPSRYKHWRLETRGPIATLTLDVPEDGGLRADYALKQNSYDLSVDIELHDAVERLRFEHPNVRTVIVTGGQPKVFCAGANIRMLGSSTHHFKVNFCKYTNETRCGIEEASREAGLTWIAALNGTAAGGGYELALACDYIALIDDRSSAVSLPEVPLLGVLPGTGGLTRLVDKRRVRRDLADVFCTKAEGFRARDALRYGFVDATFPRSRFDAEVEALAQRFADRSPAQSSEGITLTPLHIETDESGNRTYPHVALTYDAAQRTATLRLHAPEAPPPTDEAAWRALGSEAWSLAVFRELEDALLHLRFNQPETGLVLVHTDGPATGVLAWDRSLQAIAQTWLGREIRAYQARVLRRLDNMSKSLFAFVTPESCFVGSFAEILLASDRIYMLDDDTTTLTLTEASMGAYPTTSGMSRLEVRFYGEQSALGGIAQRLGEPLGAEDAVDLGLVTVAPDGLDWDDEIRIAIEERVSLSPDALTGMEQNLRCVGPETFETKIYGRLTAWQNWIFQRPNAVGEHGALTLYGHPETPSFDWGRT